MKPSPRGGWHCPGPASRLWHCPDSSFAPLGLTPYAGQILPATHPVPPLASVHHGLKHFQKQLVHGHLALQLHPIEMGQDFACCLAEERQRKQQPACTPPLSTPSRASPASFILQQGLVQGFAQLLHSLRIFNMHRV